MTETITLGGREFTLRPLKLGQLRHGQAELLAQLADPLGDHRRQGVLDRAAGRYVEGPYRWHVIEGAGHYPHEERPDAFETELRGWLADPEPER